MIARVLGALVRLRPAAPLPTAAEHRARVEAARAKAAQLPPERQGLIAQGDLCHARARRLQADNLRLRTAATRLVGNVRCYLALREEADAEQYLMLLGALGDAADDLAAAMAPPPPSEGERP